MQKKIYILDTTLRDGEQVPGAKLNLNEKLEIAKQLIKLNVDMIEVGFPASSIGDFESVREISRQFNNKDITITALGRANKDDILKIYDSIKYAYKPMIHIVLGSSDVHINKKFNKTKDEILDLAVDSVRYAKTLLPDVQYSLEDATRSEFEYIWKTIEKVVDAGATIVNIGDTVGYATPEEFGELISKINYRLKNLNDKVLLSVHCHNDIGLATANTLAAIKYGADKVECTVNGIGERAGNAAIEEVVMGLQLRQEYYNAYCNINTKEIYKTSNIVSALMGLDVQVNKAIIGDNAFAHSSGIHQDGLLKSSDVYEVIKPKDVGVNDMEITLTARSGKHAFRHVLEKLGYSDLSEEEFMYLHTKFLELADRKKEIYLHDINVIINQYIEEHEVEYFDKGIELYELLDFQIVSNKIFPTATVKVKKGEKEIIETSIGNGPVDALYTVLARIVDIDVKLEEYRISSISRGKDALGRVSLKLISNNKTFNAKAIDTDVLKASAVAYLNGVNAIIVENNNQIEYIGGIPDDSQSDQE